MITWEEKWRELRFGGIYPLPLATQTQHSEAGWEVSVVMLTEVEGGSGYGTVPIWTHREPATDDQSGDYAEGVQVTCRAVEKFARRLAEVLADSPDAP